MPKRQRRDEVAKLAGCHRLLPMSATAEAVKRDMYDVLPRDLLLHITTMRTAFFWKHERVYYFDDATWGDVVRVTDLAYSPETGLTKRPQ